MTGVDLPAIREAVSDALDAVDGVSCTPRFRQISRKGEAVIRFASLGRDSSGFGYIVTLQALVALPTALKDAEAFLDAHLDDVLTALEAEVIILDVAPIQLQLDSGLVPALQVTGTRAA